MEWGTAVGLAPAKLVEGAVELAVEHGLVADKLEQAFVGGEGVGKAAAVLTQAVIAAGGVKFVA